MSNSLPDRYQTPVFASLDEILHAYLPEDHIQDVLSQLRSVVFSQSKEVSKQTFERELRACKRCERQELTPPQQSIGNVVDPSYLFVANGVWTEELRDFLRVAADEIELPRSQVCLSVLGRCMKKPTSEERENCSDWVAAEIERLQPRLILPLGNDAVKHFLGDITLSSDHGKIYWMGPWAILPLYGLYYYVSSNRTALLKNDLLAAMRFVAQDATES